MSVRNKTIGTAATEAEKEAFKGFCMGHGMSASEMIRLLISKVCPQIQAGELPEKNIKQLDKQMMLRWHMRDWDALAVAAKKEGITKQQWIRKKVRASLHNAVPISEKERQDLASSTRELGAIGRNLNQIARQLNETGGADNQMTLDYTTSPRI